MIFISHRGNTNGSSELENHPSQIEKCLNNSLDCEIDLWIIFGKFYLGHDKPQYPVSKDWLVYWEKRLWIHCKNTEAIDTLVNSRDHSLNFFWHGTDSYTITSKKYVWVYPGELIIKGSIAVLPELWNYKERKSELNKAYAICTDFIELLMIEYK